MLVPPQRVLIHVGAKTRGLDLLNQLPYCWELPLRNAEKMGQFDRDMAFPKSAIIGYVDVVDIVQDSQSVWAQYAQEPDAKPVQHYVLRNAHLFKEPILNVKGRLGVWDIPEIDENNLPETVDIPKLERRDETLVYPCNEFLWECLLKWVNGTDTEDKEINLYLVNDNFELLIENPDELEPYPIKKLLLTRNGESIEVNVAEIYVDEMTYDDTNELIQYETPSGVTCDGLEIAFLMEHPSKSE
jgi:hypothetical protein